MERSPTELDQKNDKLRRIWAKQATRYDTAMSFCERRLFGTEHRGWACSRAQGQTLEVAVGTGLNIPLYDPALSLVGIDLSPEMLSIARGRAAEVGRSVDLRQGDAHALPFADESFDTVVCTYSLCNIPDVDRAIAEMKRVLRPDGRLILVDHISSHSRTIFWIQKVIEFFSVRFEGDHMTRRPREQIERQGFAIAETDRLALGGIVERLVAMKSA
jgi:ubiquinone/menaquinone biosynthesis C-methylase UbiE